MYSQSIADYGAQKILHMDGSILGYIQNGNPYDKAYYNKQSADEFVKNKQTNNKLNVNKGNVLKTIASGLVVFAGIASLVALLKKKGNLKPIKSLNFKESFNKLSKQAKLAINKVFKK